MSTAKQRQDIGYMRKLLGLDDDTYREILSSYNSAQSSKDLSVNEANILIKRLRDTAKETGIFKPKKSTIFKQYKYNNLGIRKGFATPAQMRKIEAMWFNVSYQKTEDKRKEALRTFIKKITGKDDIKFINPQDVSKLIKAMENMGERIKQ